jgi:hypothetical protein
MNMKTRPWIWILLGYACFLAGITTMVVVAVTHRPAEIKVTTAR